VGAVRAPADRGTAVAHLKAARMRIVIAGDAAVGQRG
jgi:hypothetical protein